MVTRSILKLRFNVTRRRLRKDGKPSSHSASNVITKLRFDVTCRRLRKVCKQSFHSASNVIILTMQNNSSNIPAKRSSKRPINLRIFLQQLANFTIWIIVVLLSIRILLLVLGANREAPFAEFILQLSDYFAWPFYGLFNDKRIGDTGFFDVSSLVGIIVYLLAGLGLNKLLSIKPH